MAFCKVKTAMVGAFPGSQVRRASLPAARRHPVAAYAGGRHQCCSQEIVIGLAPVLRDRDVSLGSSIKENCP
jgi:hypothetical protein